MDQPLTATVRAFPNSSAAYRGVANRLAELASTPARGRSRFSLGLSGGSTPESLFHLLVSEYAGRLRWSEIEFGFADERAVGPDDPRSNYGLARGALFDPLGIAGDQVHRIEGELRPVERACRRYERNLRSLFAGGSATFDLVLLGMGPDGHTASLFPGAASLEERRRWVVEEPSPPRAPNVARITLSLPAIARARHALFVVLGKEKRRALAEVLGDPKLGTERASLPAGRVRATEGVEWFVDRDAAPDRTLELPDRR